MFRKIRDGAKLLILIVSSGVMPLLLTACRRERALTLEEIASAQRVLPCPDLEVDARMQDTASLVLPSAYMNSQFDALDRAIGSSVVRTGNEAHDCQRLFGKNGEEGPVAGVYALQGMNNPNYDSFTSVAAVWSDGDYNDLGIKQGNNCLFVKGKNNSLDGLTWEAYMVPAADTPCDAVQTPAGKALPVYRVADDNSPWSDNPPTAARWVDWNDRYYIGFQCQEYFCFVGTEEKGKPPRNFVGEKHARGDEQLLAVKDNTTGKWRRSKLRANLRPQRDLGEWDNDDFKDFRKVATLHLSGGGSDAEAKAKYKAKFGADNGNISVELKYDGTEWWVRYSTKPGSIYPVAYQGGSMKSGRGTTRFFWSDSDEKLWIQCAGGCCGAGT